jgi:hypothetical protein
VAIGPGQAIAAGFLLDIFVCESVTRDVLKSSNDIVWFILQPSRTSDEGSASVAIGPGQAIAIVLYESVTGDILNSSNGGFCFVSAISQDE